MFSTCCIYFYFFFHLLYILLHYCFNNLVMHINISIISSTRKVIIAIYLYFVCINISVFQGCFLCLFAFKGVELLYVLHVACICVF